MILTCEVLQDCEIKGCHFKRGDTPRFAKSGSTLFVEKEHGGGWIELIDITRAVADGKVTQLTHYYPGISPEKGKAT